MNNWKHTQGLGRPEIPCMVKGRGLGKGKLEVQLEAMAPKPPLMALLHAADLHADLHHLPSDSRNNSNGSNNKGSSGGTSRSNSDSSIVSQAQRKHRHRETTNPSRSLNRNSRVRSSQSPWSIRMEQADRIVHSSAANTASCISGRYTRAWTSTTTGASARTS
jgi:hypothetical protein